MERAKGVGKEFIMDFKNVFVNGSTLEIHLYWTGKGTTAIPDRGVYGPLISAITVTPSQYISAYKLYSYLPTILSSTKSHFFLQTITLIQAGYMSELLLALYLVRLWCF